MRYNVHSTLQNQQPVVYIRLFLTSIATYSWIVLTLPGKYYVDYFFIQSASM